MASPTSTSFGVVAGKAGGVRIRDNFAGRNVQGNLQGVQKVGADYVDSVERGTVIEGRL